MTGRHWTERLARRAVPDFAICNSAYTSGSLPLLFPGVPSAVVYAPVDVARTPMDAATRAAVRASLETPAAATVIIQVSRSEAWKGHARLLEALAELRDVPGWIWWQVGGAQRPAEAAFLSSLREAAGRYGIGDRIRWIGERTDVPQLLAAADFHCQANLSPEPFGIAFVEALASGLPVVSTDLGGAREIVDSTCGVLVAPGDRMALAAALRRLIGDSSLRAQLGHAAPDRARRLCDPSVQLRRLASALRDMTPVGVGA
jgi:glycosyltransferase involved in cell wall biosynthesis